MTLRNDFPIFVNNPWLVYLDSTASSQKPQYVIDAMKKYLEHDYSNIHRGMYSLAERSEDMYERSKKKVCEMIGGNDWREVIYSFNSNYALNLLSLSLWRSKMLKKWDTVLVSIVEHHANVVPWLILKEEIGIEVDYVNVKEDYTLDMDDLKLKMSPQVKVVSLTHVSNVTGEIFSLKQVWEILDEVYWKKDSETIPSQAEDRGSPEWQNTRPLFIVDGSQSIPHFQVNVTDIGCDFLFFTGHKVFADSGIGVLWGKKEILQNMQPGISWGGAIAKVTKESFIATGLPDRFEAGTPNVTGAASLLAAFEYIEKVGGYKKIEEIEYDLMKYTLEKFLQIWAKFRIQDTSNLNRGEIVIYGNNNFQSRVGVFSFEVVWVHSHDISEFLADKDICIRAGQHCAEPFLESLDISHTCRMSLHAYNTRDDIDRFFEALLEAKDTFLNL